MSANKETPLTQSVPVSASSDTKSPKKNEQSLPLADFIKGILDENSAQDIIQIDIREKSSIADFMIIASGRSNRHVSALSDYVMRSLKERGHKDLGVEGLEGCDWVLVDVGDVIVHIFRPEVRVFYNLEKIWSVPLPEGLVNVTEAAPQDDDIYNNEPTA